MLNPVYDGLEPNSLKHRELRQNNLIARNHETDPLFAYQRLEQPESTRVASIIARKHEKLKQKQQQAYNMHNRGHDLTELLENDPMVEFKKNIK